MNSIFFLRNEILDCVAVRLRMVDAQRMQIVAWSNRDATKAFRSDRSDIYVFAHACVDTLRKERKRCQKAKSDGVEAKERRANL